ncbi:MAG: hypothetical protein ACI94Y_003026 [Maribacter sp.]|jgi:hypothetical protein
MFCRPFRIFRYKISIMYHQLLNRNLLILLLSLFNVYLLSAQVDHYETIVYDDDVWSYRIADSEPPNNWMQPAFNDNSWTTGQGGFGYADNDDNTVLPASFGVYIRHDFDVVELTDITKLILDADYDDAFVAYLNGVEIARGNIGTENIPPAYDDQPDDYHEAVLYEGGIPERFFLDNQINLLNEGANTLAIHLLNYSANSSDLSGRFFLSVGISNTSNNYGATPDWFENVFDFSFSNLPIIVINSNELIQNEPSVTAQMGIIDNNDINNLSDPFNDYDGQISIEIRGASSQNFEKKGYRIETQDETGANNNVSLLGMPVENDWVLHGPYSDKSLIRNALTYELGSWTGRYAPRTRFCELMLNNEYRGVYLLVEKIKRDVNRVEIAKVTDVDLEGDELTGGYLLQIDRDNEDIENEGWFSENGVYPYFYVVEDPKYDEILPVQRNYIENHINDFEEAMSSPNYPEAFGNYVDIGSFVDYFLVNELAKHIDAFKLSFYLHKKKDSNGGKLHIGPIWDFNLAYGNWDYACDPNPNSWIHSCTTVAVWVSRGITIPAVQDSIHCRWVELRETVYQTETIMDYIDGLEDLLSDAQERNFQAFPILGEYVWPNDFIGETYEAEINFLKNYVQVRLDWMDDNMIGDTNDCQINTSNNNLIESIAFELFPNPIQDKFQVKYSSEEINAAFFSIYSVEGKLMVQKAINSAEILEINSSNWSVGNYIYNIHLDGKILVAGMVNK